MSFHNSQMVCSICSKDLDIASRWPRLIPNTGETICQPCVSSIVDQSIDPKLVKHISYDLQQLREIKRGLHLDDFPLNAILLRYLQIQKSHKKTSKNSKVPNQNGVSINKENILQDQDQSIGKILIDGDNGDTLTTSVEEQNKEFLEELSSSVQKKKPTNKILQKKLKFATQSGISQADIDDSFTSYNSFKANIQSEKLNKQLIDEGNLCEIHRRQLEVVCLECHCMICTNCALFGAHRGHNIYSKEDILIMLEKKGEELYEQLEKLHQNSTLLGKQIYDESFKDCVKGMIKQHQSQIKQEFEQLRQQLNESEQYCLKQISDQLGTKITKWTTWWDNQLNHSMVEDQIQEWIHTTENVFEKLSDKNDNSYWDKISLVDGQKNKGKQLEKQLTETINRIKVFQDELQQSTINVIFNNNGIKNIFENFCRVTPLQRNVSFYQSDMTDLVESKKITRQTSIQHEDSDLLQEVNFSMSDQNKNPEQSCYEALQQSPFGINASDQQKIFSTSFSQFFTNTTQPFFGMQNNPQLDKSGNKQKNTSFTTNQLNQSRLHRSTTPQEKFEMQDHSLSPLSLETTNKLKQSSANPENLNTLRQSTRKKVNYMNLLAQKLGNQLEELRKGKSEATVDLSNLDFSLEMAQLLGQEIKFWKVKTIKMMKNKMQDDHLEMFFLTLGGENEQLQSINLAQNLLTDRAIEIVLNLRNQRTIGPAMKNIILSHNKINARHCKELICQLKSLNLTITL